MTVCLCLSCILLVKTFTYCPVNTSRLCLNAFLRICAVLYQQWCITNSQHIMMSSQLSDWANEDRTQPCFLFHVQGTTSRETFVYLFVVAPGNLQMTIPDKVVEDTTFTFTCTSSDASPPSVYKYGRYFKDYHRIIGFTSLVCRRHTTRERCTNMICSYWKYFYSATIVWFYAS